MSVAEYFEWVVDVQKIETRKRARDDAKALADLASQMEEEWTEDVKRSFRHALLKELGVGMEPEVFYRDHLTTIYHSRCEEVILTLPNNYLLLTDPPYGLGDRMIAGQSNTQWSKKWNKAETSSAVWDQETANATLMRELIDRAKHSIIWGGNDYDFPPTRCWLIWQKPERSFSCADAEMAWTDLDAVSRTFDGLRNYHNWKWHPTEKPLPLMEWCLEQVKGAIEFVLDPFMGSGTTLIAARRAGIRSIGIEQREEYCQAAVDRLNGVRRGQNGKSQRMFNFDDDA